mgnify:CR=1 FL=1
MEVITYKCPNCGGELTFDPQTQKYKCEYCFSYFTEDQEELMSLFEKMGPDDRQRLLAFADGLASDL